MSADDSRGEHRPARAWVDDEPSSGLPTSPSSPLTQVLPQARARRAADPLPEEADQAEDSEDLDVAAPEPAARGRRAWVEDEPAEQDSAEHDSSGAEAGATRILPAQKAEPSSDQSITSSSTPAVPATAPGEGSEGDQPARSTDTAKGPDNQSPDNQNPDNQNPDNQNPDNQGPGTTAEEDSPTVIRRHEPDFLAPAPMAAPAPAPDTRAALEDPTTQQTVRRRLTLPVVALVIGLLAVAGCVVLVVTRKLEEPWGLWVLLVAAGIAGGFLSGGVIGLIGWSSLRSTLRTAPWQPASLELRSGNNAVVHSGETAQPVELEKSSSGFGDPGQRIPAEVCLVAEKLVVAVNERATVLRTWPPRGAKGDASTAAPGAPAAMGENPAGHAVTADPHAVTSVAARVDPGAEPSAGSGADPSAQGSNEPAPAHSAGPADPTASAPSSEPAGPDGATGAPGARHAFGTDLDQKPPSA